ncbi:unnamed protein product [Cuscuta europaea]|uniref:Uncharacterized protein n=1 Tax=Cuscuta europaea TaxID=41803 RepID=A0A9P0ZM79_CUSEU|nr:unnamed protein product [Cuscuta europaea]
MLIFSLYKAPQFIKQDHQSYLEHIFSFYILFLHSLEVLEKKPFPSSTIGSRAPHPTSSFCNEDDDQIFSFCIDSSSEPTTKSDEGITYEERQLLLSFSFFLARKPPLLTLSLFPLSSNVFFKPHQILQRRQRTS